MTFHTKMEVWPGGWVVQEIGVGQDFSYPGKLKSNSHSGCNKISHDNFRKLHACGLEDDATSFLDGGFMSEL